MRDRRDQGHPGEKEWEEFRSAYAAALLLIWLLRDLAEIAPDYGSSLRERLKQGIAIGESHVEDDPGSDGPALIPSATPGEPEMMDLSVAYVLENQLFPDREAPDARDFHSASRAMAVVALHSALEGFAHAMGVSRQGPLPRAIAKFLATKGKASPLGLSLGDDLTEFDEARHLFVHERGIVNERYVSNVKYNRLQESEFLPLPAERLSRYARTTWEVASLLRSAASPAP